MTTFIVTEATNDGKPSLMRFIEAEAVYLDGGCLVLRMLKGDIVAAYAAGGWISCVAANPGFPQPLGDK